MADTVAVSSSFAFGSRHFTPKPQVYAVERMQAPLPDVPAETGKRPRLRAATAEPFVVASLAAGDKKSARLFGVARSDAADNAARFDAFVKQTGLTSEKLAGLFARPRPANMQPLVAKARAPASERFGSRLAGSIDQPQTLLAYADPSPAAAAALSALLRATPEEDLAEVQDPDLEMDEDAVALPDYEDIPLPQPRPKRERAEELAASKTDEPKKAEERETPKPKQLAYARPDDPTEQKSGGGVGQGLRKLFGGGTRAGGGVAVYDISAARVYMPDGSVLEAHSGIGKMADNPRYVHVKMNGPTPPHTYNLRMREKRFHGVEAIRMLPVDGKNKHGRDGFLTHSYLLRGGRAESHGCVAFKDYDKFLRAFKQGKVKQLVVVPSGGRAAMLVASNGRASDG